ncbi:MAG: hypothetical protein JWL76_2145 [Thermoleophilia bacterium]|nr:hypothetical protein [Thermoleophilia bacterium]
MPVRDDQPDDLNALFALVREVRDEVLTVKVDMRHAANHGDRISQLELSQARTEGSVRVLLWLVPGGPAIVTLIGAIGWYASR